jgi:Cytochrome c554 and c-prime
MSTERELQLELKLISMSYFTGKSFFVVTLLRATLVATSVLTSCNVQAQTQSAKSNDLSKPTEARLKASGWWPTKGDRSRDEYVGAAECANCHSSVATSFRGSAMAHAAARAPDSDSLREHENLAFQIGRYSYRISNSGGKNILRISRGSSSHSANLLWAFGMGRMAQTYVYEENGNFFEGHLSFYTALQGLDITPGHPRTEPPNLEEGAGRRISIEERRRCFGCHTTESTTKYEFNAQKLVLGVSCESCHGPGAAHVAAAKSGDFDRADASIVNPAYLSPAESVDFCGACHRTWQDVVTDGPTRIGPLNVRFAPYRLENSRCWKEGTGDARITCLTCHDPHKPLADDPASYDSACLECHVAAGTQKSETHDGDHRTACTIGVKLCVTCHMPKFKNPAFHFAFTDHWIRIAPPGAPLPD